MLLGSVICDHRLLWQGEAHLETVAPDKGNAMHAVRTQCEVLDVGKDSHPSYLLVVNIDPVPLVSYKGKVLP